MQMSIDKNVKAQLAEGPSPELKSAHKAMRKALKQSRRASRQLSAADAHRRVAFEEVSTKQFYGKFKKKGVKRYIQELYESDKDSGLPNVDGPTTGEPVEMCSHAARYYEKLMSAKSSDPEAAEVLLGKLSEEAAGRPHLRAADRKKLEGKITEGEVRKAIRRTAKGKSPGPDGLPAEYFHVMENIIAFDLADYYNELYEDRRLTDNMLLGEIILLYKTKDPRDIRNYRPITLLQVHLNRRLRR